MQQEGTVPGGRGAWGRWAARSGRVGGNRGGVPCVGPRGLPPSSACSRGGLQALAAKVEHVAECFGKSRADRGAVWGTPTGVPAGAYL